MKGSGYIWLLTLVLILAGCSNTRFLVDDQLLYTGQKKVQISSAPEDLKNATRRQVMQGGTPQKPNNSLFGRRLLPPVGLWTYNYWKQDDAKKFGRWVHQKLSASPVLISDINPELRAQKIENDLFDQGFFQARAWSVVDTSSRNVRKAKVEYFVEVGPSYSYREIRIDPDMESMDSLVTLEAFHSRIKPGDQFEVKRLQQARSGVSMEMQNLGYFYFNDDFLELEADTSLGSNQLNLKLERRQDLPADALTKYSIDSILVFLSKSSDSIVSWSDPLIYKGISLYSPGDYLKPEIIRSAIYFEPGDLYNYSSYQQTIARLNRLGIFSFVKIAYEHSGEDSLKNRMKVRIDLILADQINLNFETDLVVKSSGFLGPGLKVGVSNNNTFKGAERIQVDLKGAIEWQWGPKEESQLGTFSYEFGINSALSFPRLILPGPHERTKNLLNQGTSIQLNFDILNRVQYYSMFSTMTSYRYSWGRKETIKHSFSPVYLNSVSLLATTPAFDSVIDANIYIRKSFEEQFILGMKYNFSYDNTHRPQLHNIYFQAGAGSSGNLLDLFAGIGKEESDRPYQVMNNVYSQHLKFTTDFRYYLNGYNKTLAARVYAGVGIPYSNSSVLPYVEQFYSGGAYSIRGFTARTVGPGSYHEEDSDHSYVDQSGDVKLEANMEFRFGISRITKGAVFMDAGNIWLINEDENRPGSKFDLPGFYNQLAVGAGVGLRFDFNFFVLRTDLGFPLRTPYKQDDRNWLTGGGNIFSGALFYFAIGYPF